MQPNSVGVVAAVQSGAAQIGVPAAGVFVGAVQHGLPYVALACQSLFGPGMNVLAVIVRKGVAIKTPQDFVGKRVAVPGLRGGTQIMFMEWLRENGVDPAKVTYVEVNYPQQADILRGAHGRCGGDVGALSLPHRRCRPRHRVLAFERHEGGYAGRLLHGEETLGQSAPRLGQGLPGCARGRRRLRRHERSANRR